MLLFSLSKLGTGNFDSEMREFALWLQVGFSCFQYFQDSSEERWKSSHFSFFKAFGTESCTSLWREKDTFLIVVCLYGWRFFFEVGGLAADYDPGRTMDRLISRSLSSLGDETELHLRRLAFIHKLETKSSAIRERERR